MFCIDKNKFEKMSDEETRKYIKSLTGPYLAVMKKHKEDVEKILEKIKIDGVVYDDGDDGDDGDDEKILIEEVVDVDVDEKSITSD